MKPENSAEFLLRLLSLTNFNFEPYSACNLS